MHDFDFLEEVVELTNITAILMTCIPFSYQIYLFFQ